MEKVILREFQPEDIFGIEQREINKEALNKKELLKIANDYHENGPCFTGIAEGKVLACGGVRIFWKGTGEAWMMFSKDIEKYPKEAVYIVFKHLKGIIEHFKLHRVQAHTKAGVDVFARYLEHLGFQKEAYLRMFGPNKEDYIQYVLLME